MSKKSASSNNSGSTKPRSSSTTAGAETSSRGVGRLALFGVGALALVVASAFVYMNFIRGDAPAQFELSANSGGNDSPDGAQPVTAETLAGSWLVAEGSQAGYRVVEDFVGGIQNFEAVGRTSQVTGSMTIAGTTASDVSITVDIASMTSDSSKRDGRFSGPIMSASEFPTASFSLDDPIDFGSIPASDDSIMVAGTGQLTLRGQTRQVDVAIDAQIVGTTIEVVGSIPILFADFDIANPSIDGVLSIQDAGTVEFQLSFAQE